MRTKAIERFLQTAYSDEKLAALLAHTEDGKLSYWSCCCFVGVATADHALREKMGSYAASVEPHYIEACDIEGADEAEQEFITLAEREGGLPVLATLIRTEIARRDALRTQDTCNTKDSVRSPELAGVLIGD